MTAKIKILCPGHQAEDGWYRTRRGLQWGSLHVIYLFEKHTDDI